ncbi:unnamed protein product [Allacma fusca]|uniref:NAD-dependent protein deacylase n=1 Tax=Allacma fusca TaxID=39272 RepID=A0A8J2LEZ8_9HEXA|nr:unnamed protein product [Allacma fusca]
MRALFTRGSASLARDFQFVPKHSAPRTEDVTVLRKFYEDHGKIFVLTGAGISTESGIPDYRSEGVGLYNRTNHRPMYIQEFMKSSEFRKRYWARNYVGWPKFSSAEPNEAHKTVREWEVEGKVGVLVTQNVDRLHHKAGSTSAIELHGTGYEVICLQCKDFREDRHQFQKVLDDSNPHFMVEGNGNEIRPDGDIDLDPSQVEQFVIPPCPHCGGILKPDIVFFGDNVPKSRVEKIYESLSTCDSLLVLGSSLQVFSSYRFILRAKEQGIPIAIVTLGPTRGDTLASIKLTSRVGEILSLVN